MNGKNGLKYVVHKHAASHLHYDLRLEMDGALKSWAVPKEPPMEKGVKRLAVAVEDHPMGYETFEGTIPEGEYGAGTVEIWDKGTYELIKKDAGTIEAEINGKRLKGTYVLVRFRSKDDKKGKNWLFFRK